MDREFLANVRKEGKEDEAYRQAKEQEAVTVRMSPKDRKVKELSCKDNLLYQQNLLWIPKGLVQEIIESEYDTKVAGHMGQEKTIELI